MKSVSKSPIEHASIEASSDFELFDAASLFRAVMRKRLWVGTIMVAAFGIGLFYSLYWLETDYSAKAHLNVAPDSGTSSLRMLPEGMPIHTSTEVFALLVKNLNSQKALEKVFAEQKLLEKYNELSGVKIPRNIALRNFTEGYSAQVRDQGQDPRSVLVQLTVPFPGLAGNLVASLIEKAEKEVREEIQDRVAASRVEKLYEMNFMLESERMIASALLDDEVQRLKSAEEIAKSIGHERLALTLEKGSAGVPFAYTGDFPKYLLGSKAIGAEIEALSKKGRPPSRTVRQTEERLRQWAAINPSELSFDVFSGDWNVSESENEPNRFAVFLLFLLSGIGASLILVILFERLPILLKHRKIEHGIVRD